MTDELHELREAVATAHGLDDRALPFITGTNLAELEDSAAALARLVGTTEPEPPETLANVVSRSLAEKAERRQRLVASLHSGAEQPRDARGRFSAGFDGGARRTSVPEPRSPEQQHDELVLDMARLSRAYGARF